MIEKHYAQKTCTIVISAAEITITLKSIKTNLIDSNSS